jgi:hypothetical protein
MTPLKRLNLRIDPKLSASLKKTCEDMGISQTKFISHAIRAKIDGDSAHTIIENQVSFLIEKLANLDRKLETRFDELHGRQDEIIAAIEKRNKSG